MPPPNERLDWIQCLRGIAALMVVLVHVRYALPGTPQAEGVEGFILYPMAMGVDLFFIISGFLMVLTTRHFDGSIAYIWTFFSKRLARIWPVYAFTSLLAMMILFHGLNALKHPEIIRHFVEGLFFIPHDPVNNHMYFNMAVDVSWTLCFEMYFYLIFALSMLVGRFRYIAIAIWLSITLIAIPILMGNFSLNPALQPSPINGFRYANLALNPIIWDFVYGMLIAWMYIKPVKLPSAVIYVVMFSAILGMLVFWDDFDMGNFYGPFAWGAPLAVLFLGIAMLSKNGKINVPAWTIWLGGISYSLYLTHIYVFKLTDQALGAMHLDNHHMIVARIAVRPAVAILVAYAVYTFVENKLSKVMLRWMTGKQTGNPVQSLLSKDGDAAGVGVGS